MRMVLLVAGLSLIAASASAQSLYPLPFSSPLVPIVALPAIPAIAVPVVPRPALPSLTPPIVVSRDGQFLGVLSSNRYDPLSVSNPYGPYGSPYSPTSINNQFGPYGSPYSPTSVRNPYAIAAPVIVQPTVPRVW